MVGGGVVRRWGHCLDRGWLVGRARGVEIEQRRLLGVGGSGARRERRRSSSGELTGKEAGWSRTLSHVRLVLLLTVLYTVVKWEGKKTIRTPMAITT
jgi:hypothetical protein